jgi:hypothetical protein
LGGSTRDSICGQATGRKANPKRNTILVNRSGAKTEETIRLPAVPAIAAVSAISTAATTATASAVATTTTAVTATSTGATATTATRTFGLRPCFVHYQVPAPEVLAVQGSNRAVRFFIVGNLDEGETAGLSCKTVAN